MRTIDADALLKKIEEDAEFYLVGDDENSKAVGVTLLGVKEQINAMPTIEPRRMRGRWEYLDYGGVGNYHCSACRRICVNKGDYDFCPFCGADMRGGQDGTT